MVVVLQCRLHGALAASAVRDSATAVHHELLECYALIEKLGRGVVYYGSARLKQDSPHWARAVELGQQVAQLLGCTTWSGGGPGCMEAATEGVLCCALLCCAGLGWVGLCCARLCYITCLIFAVWCPQELQFAESSERNALHPFRAVDTVCV